MSLSFSPEAKRRLDEIRAQYPTSQAACLPALHLAQEQFGHVGEDVTELVARELGLPIAHVYGVVTFYTMFHQHPVGKNYLMVCTNISCMLRGAGEVLQACEKRLGIKAGETTPDGKFTLVEEECLAACAGAPMMICGTSYHLNLDSKKVVEVIDDLERQTPAGTRGAGEGH